MGIVYEATQISLNRVVALKVVAPDLSEDAGFQKRFRREGELQSRINHPHIVPVHEAGQTDEALFLSMMLIRGPTLKDLIVARELDAGRALRLLGPIGDAIDTAHTEGLVHRDLKPQNILVARRDHAYLSDFGLTQAVGESSLTASGAFVGTYDYVSPEQISGERATARSDVYSFAAVLYEALTGVVPYPKPSKAAVLFAHVADPPPRVSDQRPELPADLDRVIERGMAKRPADRHPTASDLISDAERALGRRLRAVTRPPGPAESPEEIGVRQGEDKIPTAQTRSIGQRTAALPPPSPSPSPPPPTPPIASGMAPAGLGPAASKAGHQGELLQAAGLPMPPGPAARLARKPPRPVHFSARLAVAAGAAVLLAAAAGALIASPATRRLGYQSAGSATVGPVQVDIPRGWRVAHGAAGPGGLRFSSSISLAAGGPSDIQSVTVGQVDAAGPALLPQAFLSSLSDKPRGTAVSLRDGVEALRYATLPANPGGIRRMYVIPTSASVVTVACVSQSQSTPGLPLACDRVAARIVIHGVHVFHVGPEPAYARAVGQAVETLKRDRGAPRAVLRRGRSAGTQASASGLLARAYLRTVKTLTPGHLAIPPQVRAAHARLLLALGHASIAYRHMALAAQQRKRTAYGRASGNASQAELDLVGAIRSLKALGYRTGG